MKERTIVSAFALLSSLGAYYYSKQYNKDTTPMVMIGGFLGAMIGEVISQLAEQEKKHHHIPKRKTRAITNKKK